MNVVKNKRAGHSTKKMVIQSKNSKNAKVAILELTKDCPNVTCIHSSPECIIIVLPL